MAELKTKLNDGNVEDFLNKVEDSKKREDSFKVLKMMKEATGEEPKMWGDSIVGLGTYTYKYSSGRTGEWMRIGFSPRKTNLTLYIMPGFDIEPDSIKDLGKFKTGKSCLYIKKLEDVDIDILKQMIKKAIDFMIEKYPE